MAGLDNILEQNKMRRLLEVIKCPNCDKVLDDPDFQCIYCGHWSQFNVDSSSVDCFEEPQMEDRESTQTNVSPLSLTLISDPCMVSFFLPL
mgnify:CR=1 FL=1|jgi:hypothetical protein